MSTSTVRNFVAFGVFLKLFCPKKARFRRETVDCLDLVSVGRAWAVLCFLCLTGVDGRTPDHVPKVDQQKAGAFLAANPLSGEGNGQ